VELGSDPLGVFGAAILQRTDLRVASGDRFFLYTDGLIESSPGGGRREGLQRLVNACIRHRSASLPESTRMIAGELCPDGYPPHDDLLLLAAEVRE
jgi:sigma-B regulation protein RsbU (phosphoserine phosphatase)